MTEGDVYYKVASAWDCAGWGWWSTAYDVTAASYNTITAVVNTDNQVKIVAQGSDWQTAASDTKNVTTAGTAEEVTLVVDLTTSEDVMTVGLVQLYFQNSVVGQLITVKSITFSNEDGTTEESAPEVPEGSLLIPLNGDFTNWGGSSTFTLDSGSIYAGDAVFTGEWSSCIWQFYWPTLDDLSGYEKIVCQYSNFASDDVSCYLQFYVEDYTDDDNKDTEANPNVPASETNTVEFTLANHSIDYSKIGQLGLQASVACTLYIDAIYATGSSTAISSVASDVEVIEVARYNLMGQKLSGAEKGINIIVYSDGSAKKVLVK